MKKCKISKYKTIVVMSIIIVMSLTSVVYGYALWSSGYYQKNVPINTTAGVLSTYSTAVSGAVSSWNSAGTPCSITSGSAPYKNIMYTQAQDDTYYGLYAVLEQDTDSYPDHSTTKFAIIINTDMCDSLTATAKQSVVCHELGHALGLDDLVSGTAIMNHNRNRATIYKPQGDDKLGVAESWE